MFNGKDALFCALINFRKWLINPRIYTIFVLIFVFIVYHTSGLATFSNEIGYKIGPWIFTHLATPPVLQVFAFFAVLLFSDAPFQDRHTPFVAVRTGRLNWIVGQIVYILMASFVITVFTFLITILVMFNHTEWTLEWGTLIESLAMGTIDFSNTVTVSIFFNYVVIEQLSPLFALMASLLFFYLVVVLIGVVILCFNVVLKQTAGIVVAGVLIAMSFFVVYIGTLHFGVEIYYYSPVSWMSIHNLEWANATNLPSPLYALVTLSLTIILLSIMSVIAFTKKDMNLKEGGI